MIVTILVFILILSILVFVHELGHFIAAKKNGVLVEEFGFGLPPRAIGKKFGETLYSLNWLPFGGFVKLLGEEQHELEGKKLPEKLKNRTFTSKSHFQKAVIIVAGVSMNFLLGWGIMTYLFTQGTPVHIDYVKILAVSKNSPTEVAGIQKNDIIQNIKYKNKSFSIKSVQDLIVATEKVAGHEAILTVKRNTSTLSIAVTPRTNPPKGEGAMGVAISDVEIKKYSLIQAPYFALLESVTITKTIGSEIILNLYRFVTFQKVPSEVAGPIGVAKMTGDTIKYGFDAVLQELGLLSFNLAIVNILPFPALDGGKLVLIIYEAISRRKVRQDIEAKLNLVGFAVLITFILLISVHDITNLFIK